MQIRKPSAGHGIAFGVEIVGHASRLGFDIERKVEQPLAPVATGPQAYLVQLEGYRLTIAIARLVDDLEQHLAILSNLISCII